MSGFKEIYDKYIDSIAYCYNQAGVIVLPDMKTINLDFQFLPWDKMDSYSKERYGYTLREALCDVSKAVKVLADVVVIVVDEYKYDEERIEIKNELDETLNKLLDVYISKPVYSLNKIETDNYIVINRLPHLCKKIYNLPCKTILRGMGIMEKEEDGLQRLTKALHEKYDKNKAVSLTQVTKENKDIGINLLNEYARSVFNKTAKEYLLEIGIVVEEEKIHKNDKYTELIDNIEKLKAIYRKNKAITIEQIKRENPTLKLNHLAEYAKTNFNETSKSYLTRIGILEEKSHVYKYDSVESEIELLKNRYKDVKAKNILDVQISNSDLDLDGIYEYARKKYDLGKKEYLEYIEVLPDENVNIKKNTKNNSAEQLGELKEKYSVNKVETLSQLKKENKNVNFYYMNNYIKSEFNMTAKDYFTEIGILQPRTNTGVSGYESLNKITDDMEHLKRIYNIYPAESYEQLKEENKDIDFANIEEIARNLYNSTAEKYLSEKGIIRKVSLDTDSKEMNYYAKKVDNEDFLDDIDDNTLIANTINILKFRYRDESAKSLFEIYRDNADLDLERLEELSIRIHKDYLQNQLIKEGVLNAVYYCDTDWLIKSRNEEKKLHAESIDLRGLDANTLRKMQVEINRACMISHTNIFTDAELLYIESLNSDCFMNFKDLERDFQKSFPESKNKFTISALMECGYRSLGSNIIVKKEIRTVEELIDIIFRNNKTVSFVDKEWILKNQKFSQALEKWQQEYEIVEFDNNKYINTRELRGTGLNKKLISDYCNQVMDFMDGKIFTIDLLKKKGFKHTLEDYGFENYFYESILKNNKYIKRSKYRNQYIFKETKHTFSYGELINEIILNGPMDIYDLQDLLENDYGVVMPWYDIRNFANDAGLYYSDTMEKIYLDYDDFFEEV